MIERKDWTLIAIEAAGTQGLTPVQLQKTLFLLQKEMPSAIVGEFYNFKPYNYGPFDRDVYVDAERLTAAGDVEVFQRQGESWNRYAATRDGEIRASYAAREAAEAVKYIHQLVDWVQRQTFQDLVKAIYAKYPEMRANSVFQG